MTRLFRINEEPQYKELLVIEKVNWELCLTDPAYTSKIAAILQNTIVPDYPIDTIKFSEILRVKVQSKHPEMMHKVDVHKDMQWVVILLFNYNLNTITVKYIDTDNIDYEIIQIL